MNKLEIILIRVLVIISILGFISAMILDTGVPIAAMVSGWTFLALIMLIRQQPVDELPWFIYLPVCSMLLIGSLFSAILGVCETYKLI